MTAFDPVRYNAAKDTAKAWYDQNRQIVSPFLGMVTLNSDGFMHLIYDDKLYTKKRNWKNQTKRFQLLPLVKPVIEAMGFCQEYLEQFENVETKDSDNKRFQVHKLVRYWGFVAVVKGNKSRIKVILKQIGNGQIIFWSVIPYWDTEFYKGVRLVGLSKGNLSAD